MSVSDFLRAGAGLVADRAGDLAEPAKEWGSIALQTVGSAVTSAPGAIYNMRKGEQLGYNGRPIARGGVGGDVGAVARRSGEDSYHCSSVAAPQPWQPAGRSSRREKGGAERQSLRHSHHQPRAVEEKPKAKPDAPEGRRHHRDRDPSPLPVAHSGSAKQLVEKTGRRHENDHCADCSTQGPRWVQVSWGVFVCIRCSGLHRKLGAHVSRVKSTTLDKWDDSEAAWLHKMGNVRANDVLEARLPRGVKPTPHSTDNEVEGFIRRKYLQEEFCEKGGKPATYKRWLKSQEKEREKEKRSKKRGAKAGAEGAKERRHHRGKHHRRSTSSGHSSSASKSQSGSRSSSSGARRRARARRRRDGSAERPPQAAPAPRAPEPEEPPAAPPPAAPTLEMLWGDEPDPFRPPADPVTAAAEPGVASPGAGAAQQGLWGAGAPAHTDPLAELLEAFEASPQRRRAAQQPRGPALPEPLSPPPCMQQPRGPAAGAAVPPLPPDAPAAGAGGQPRMGLFGEITAQGSAEDIERRKGELFGAFGEMTGDPETAKARKDKLLAFFQA
eukprot:TRINITY_DN61001_c0_g1_i1.p1 TRINITY_DN61001_c0_g1~~TRINITY_DN61001_c0_g1_i1.p1  ORF type:complete len:581 (+),score=140.02 TRINITY_DN61001_c0_g1_i1:84-1745(+)